MSGFKRKSMNTGSNTDEIDIDYFDEFLSEFKCKVPKRSSKKSSKKLHSEEKFTVKVESDVGCYNKLNEMLCYLFIEQTTDKSIILNLSDVKMGEDNHKIIYNIPLDTMINVEYCGKIIECCVKQISKDHGGNYNVIRLNEITLACFDKGVIEKMLFECGEIKDRMMIYHYKPSRRSWDEFGKVQKRDESTLILNQKDKDKILTDVTKFLDSKKIYERYGINYRRNYMFHGAPGTGKTSLVNVLAGKTNRSIYIISFDSELTDGHLYDAVSNIYNENSILLLEDIDCVFHDRNTNTNNSKVSFSALLNILDGVTKIDGLITIITTNHIERLDAALIRPGRIDMSIKFTHISEEQVTGLLNLYEIKLNDRNFKELVKKCTLNKLSPSVLSGFMFRYRDRHLNDSNYITYFCEYLEEIKTVTNLKSDSGSMYM